MVVKGPRRGGPSELGRGVASTGLVLVLLLLFGVSEVEF